MKIKGRKGFVKEEHLGPGTHGPGQGDPLGLSPGEPLWPPEQKVLETKGVHYFGHQVLVYRLFLGAKGEKYVLPHGKMGEKGVSLGEVGYFPGLGRSFRDVLALDKHLGLGGRLKTRQDFEGKALSCTTRAQHDRVASGRKAQVDLKLNGPKTGPYFCLKTS